MCIPSPASCCCAPPWRAKRNIRSGCRHRSLPEPPLSFRPSAGQPHRALPCLSAKFLYFCPMTRLQRTICLLVGCISLLAAGCNSHGDKKSEEATATLHRLPFAPLTDSLEKAKGNESAGLYFRRAELLSRNDLHELAAKDYRQSWDLQPD